MLQNLFGKGFSVLTESFRKYYGFTQEQALLAAGYYREYYGKAGKFENVVIRFA